MNHNFSVRFHGLEKLCKLHLDLICSRYSRVWSKNTEDELVNSYYFYSCFSPFHEISSVIFFRGKAFIIAEDKPMPSDLVIDLSSLRFVPGKPIII